MEVPQIVDASYKKRPVKIPAAQLAPPNPAVFFGEGWPDPLAAVPGSPLCLALENMGILWEISGKMMGKFYGFKF